MPIDLDSLATLDHRRLQVLAKEYGIKANQKKPDIIRQIAEAVAKSRHWESCSRLRIGLVRVPGFSEYLKPLPEGAHSKDWRAIKAHQIWETLKLGTPLCFLFNQVPDAPIIDVHRNDTSPNDIERCHKAVNAFIKGLVELERLGKWTGSVFDLSDLYHDEDNALDPQKVIKVVAVIIRLVDLIPYPTSGGRHIHDLPVELISNIFEIATVTDLCEPPYPARKILLVCRRWHDIAIQSGSLWTRVYVDGRLQGKKGRPTKEVDKLSSYLRLSKNKDLALIFLQDKNVRSSQPDLATYLGESAQRVRTLAVLFNSHDYLRAYTNRQIRQIDTLPCLNTLLLHQNKAGGVHSNVRSTSLRHLEALNVNLDWPTCACPNLVTLKIKERWGWGLGTGHLHRFATALPSMPLLQQLSVTQVIDNHAYIPPGYASAEFAQVTLPVLTELDLSGSAYLLSGFMRLIDAPHLVQVHMTGLNTREAHQTLSWAGRAGPFPELEALVLRFVPSPRRLLAKIVPPRETQVDLVMRGNTGTRYFDSLPGTACKEVGEAWDCAHEDCRALASQSGVSSAMTRFQIQYVGGQDVQLPEHESPPPPPAPQIDFQAYLAFVGTMH